MLDIKVCKSDYKLSIEGDLATITTETLMMLTVMHEDIKKHAGDCAAQLFKKMVSDKIPICFMDEEEIDAMLSKEEIHERHTLL